MEITRHSKLFDVLEAYPFLEAQIVNIAPPFQNLKNPVLRRTVGKIATLGQAADDIVIVGSERREVVVVAEDFLVLAVAGDQPEILIEDGDALGLGVEDRL